MLLLFKLQVPRYLSSFCTYVIFFYFIIIVDSWGREASKSSPPEYKIYYRLPLITAYIKLPENTIFIFLVCLSIVLLLNFLYLQKFEKLYIYRTQAPPLLKVLYIKSSYSNITNININWLFFYQILNTVPN